MGVSAIKIAILTSSRADFGIYKPLLSLFDNNPLINLNIIAFGTHLSEGHGYTLDSIINEGFDVKFKINTVSLGDSPFDISNSIGNTILSFSEFWRENKFDLIFALGDRYEMFAAVSSIYPFNMQVAHISGGETTLGAIDNSFRHSISLMSKFHFVSTEVYKKRLIEIIGTEENVYNVGALNIDNLKKMKFLSIEEFKVKYNIDLSLPSILITFHPETISFDKNVTYITELINALKFCRKYQLIITMPNSDTMGDMIRDKLNDFISKNNNSIGIESFGTLGYLSCMKHCSFMLGNTSSGFVEASFFPKYVINLGDRQKGRLLTPNIINSEITTSSIIDSIIKVESLKPLNNINLYGIGDSANKIFDIICKMK